MPVKIMGKIDYIIAIILGYAITFISVYRMILCEVKIWLIITFIIGVSLAVYGRIKSNDY